jgi:hypothetical protein
MDTELYRRLAADAEHLAQSAKNDTDRKSWLRVAEDWLDLVAWAGPATAPTISQMSDRSKENRLR